MGMKVECEWRTHRPGGRGLNTRLRLRASTRMGPEVHSQYTRCTALGRRSMFSTLSARSAQRLAQAGPRDHCDSSLIVHSSPCRDQVSSGGRVGDHHDGEPGHQFHYPIRTAYRYRPHDFSVDESGLCWFVTLC